MSPSPKERLGQILKRRGLITGSKLVKALDHQKMHGGRLGAIVVDLGLVAEDELLLALQEHLTFPIVDWQKAPLNESAVSLIPQSLALEKLVMPLTFIKVPTGHILVVAMENPAQKELIQMLHVKTGYPIKPMLAGRLALLAAIAEAYRHDPNVAA